MSTEVNTVSTPVETIVMPGPGFSHSYIPTQTTPVVTEVTQEVPSEVPAKRFIKAENKVALDLAKMKLENAELAYRNVVLKIYFDNKLNETDSVNDVTGEIIVG